MLWEPLWVQPKHSKYINFGCRYSQRKNKNQNTATKRRLSLLCRIAKGRNGQDVASSKIEPDNEDTPQSTHTILIRNHTPSHYDALFYISLSTLFNSSVTSMASSANPRIASEDPRDRRQSSNNRFSSGRSRTRPR